MQSNRYCTGCGAEMKSNEIDLCDVCKNQRFWQGTPEGM